MALFATLAMVTACMFGLVSLYFFARVRFARATDDDRRDAVRAKPRAGADESACMNKQCVSYRMLHASWRNRSYNMAGRRGWSLSVTRVSGYSSDSSLVVFVVFVESASARSADFVLFEPLAFAGSRLTLWSSRTSSAGL